jgi:NhaP-type Na+/H+ or K+/H+ antiporter
VTADQIFLGIALTLVLAVGSQVLAARLHIPAILVLLPVGFAAGALTDVVDPVRLLGDTFEPLVSLSVGLILYDAGLGLDLRRLRGHIRGTVIRLIGVGTAVTWVAAALLALALLGMSQQAAVMIGAILVVSGPTVVGPLLNYVRPTDRLQHVLAWEGSLIDPVGAILGALVFHAIVSGTNPALSSGVLHFAGSVGIGLLGGVVGTALLWLALCKWGLGEILGTLAQLAVVVGVTAVCDVLRDDSGLIAAIVIGLALANLPAFAVSERRPFFETLVQLVLGLLFISISATVTPQSLGHVVLPTFVFVAGLVLLVRPLVALLSTVRTDFSAGERGFIGWMAPRGIVAAATASTFAPTLASHGIGGADKILPCTFLVIVMTVTLYGLTAAPVARLLKVVRQARSRPLLVGGEPWVVELGRALRAIGLEVLMWAGPARHREAIQGAGLELAPDELITDVSNPAAQVEGVTAVLLLTEEDDFNALAATLLQGNIEGPVYRVAPPPGSHAALAAGGGGPVLFGPTLTRDAIAARHAAGGRITIERDTAPDGDGLLFRVGADGSLRPVTHDEAPPAEADDSLVLLSRPPHEGGASTVDAPR